MDTAYIETTVVGNIAGRMHPDPLIAARQAVTRKWWATAGQVYRLLASELVIDECLAGDPAAADGNQRQSKGKAIKGQSVESRGGAVV
jgi:hypothetical protein